MNPIKLRNIEIGSGIPKICVPIVGKTKEQILEEAQQITALPVDLVEWRADWFDDVYQIDNVLDVLKELRSILSELPLLMTFRTANEGGEKAITLDEYQTLYKQVILSSLVDLIDLELFMGDELVISLTEFAHSHDVKVIASNHDFKKTPAKDEIIRRLCKMQSLGTDILKIAVMPESKKDVLTLLSATEEMTSEHASKPVVTMSMSGVGSISRICGETFGSAITFGSAKQSSAPGQLEVKELYHILQTLHNV